MTKMNIHPAFSIICKRKKKQKISCLKNTTLMQKNYSFFLKKYVSKHPDESFLINQYSCEYIFANKNNNDELIAGVYNKARKLCESLKVSPSIYSDIMVIIISAVARNDLKTALTLFKVVHASIASVHLLIEVESNAPKEIGSLGGRPEHPRKAEALELAYKHWNQYPDASTNKVANYVYGRLANIYNNAPSTQAINGWLKASPRNSVD